MWYGARRVGLGLLSGALIWTCGLMAQSFDLIGAPEFYRESLLNGMQVLFLPGNAPRAPFVLMVKSGAVFDPSGKKGLTRLTALMVAGQERNRDGVVIGRALQDLTVELNVRVGWDAIYFYGVAPRDRVIEALKIVGAAIARPELLQEDLDRVRTDSIEQLHREGMDPSLATQNQLLAALFGPNPYAHPVNGTVETLSALTLVDVKKQYRKVFLPNQSNLGFVYGGDRQAALGDLSQNWGRWVRREAPAFTFRPASLDPGPRIILLEHTSDEAMFRWGTLGPEATSRDLIPLKVLEQYLTLSLPDWARDVSSQAQIRARARLEVRRMPGYLQLSIQARPRQLMAYLKKFTATVTDLQEGRLDVKRFQEAKRLVYLDMRQVLETPESTLQRLLETDLYRWGINYIAYFGLRVDRVTPEVFRETVQRYLPIDRFALVVAGPEADLRPSLELLGPLETVP